MKNYKIVKKYYNKDTKKFYIEKKYSSRKTKVQSFRSFKRFCKKVDYEIEDVALFGYSFKRRELRNLDLNTLRIDSNELIKHGVYDDSFYNCHVKQLEKLHDIRHDNIRDNITSETNLSVREAIENDEMIKVLYITDIHLDYKIKERFPNHASEFEIENYIDSFVNELLRGYHYDSYSIFIIGGDVSYNKHFVELFFKSMRNYVLWNKIIYVLGNHELWNYPHEYSIEKIVSDYRRMLSHIKVTLLHNELWVLKAGINIFYKYPISNFSEVLAYEFINDLTDEELIEYTRNAQLIVFGGLGFTGYNEGFNATDNLYNNCMRCLSEDIIESDKVCYLHTRLSKLFNNREVIFVTHTPKKDWCINEDRTSKWIYINGHSHINNCYYKDDALVLEDNQLGYNCHKGMFKETYVNKECDYFDSYSDGIHLIDFYDYKLFYICKDKKITTQKDDKVYMIKKDNSYMFFEKKNGKYYILKGGQGIISPYQDLNYYYEHISKLRNNIEDKFRKLQRELKRISNEIKEVGGTGKIHGCIIDVTYNEHIFLNPFTGEMVGYTAENISSAYVYKNINSLLYDCGLLSYKKAANIDINYLCDPADISTEIKCDSSKELYKVSKEVLKIQYLIDHDILRFWDDRILEWGKNQDRNTLLNIDNQ